MKWPAFFSRKYLRAALVTIIVPKRFVSICARNSDRGVSSMDERLPYPALLMTTSSEPSKSMSDITAFAAAASSVTSNAKSLPWSPYRSDRSPSALISRAVANTLLPAARPASTIARPRPRELPVTNHTCAIHPPLSSPQVLWRSLSNSGLDARFWRGCTAERGRTSSSEIPRSDVYLHDQSVRVLDQLARSHAERRHRDIKEHRSGARREERRPQALEMDPTFCERSPQTSMWLRVTLVWRSLPRRRFLSQCEQVRLGRPTADPRRVCPPQFFARCRAGSPEPRRRKSLVIAVELFRSSAVPWLRTGNDASVDRMRSLPALERVTDR